MRAAWERPRMHTKLSSESQKERDYPKDLDVGERITLKWIFET
jgi:hypothetical protein